jgi:hypothetical protein
MKIISLILITLFSYSNANLFACNDPSEYIGKWVGDHNSESLVQTQCGVGRSDYWMKGPYARRQCDRIPTMTPIATFLGSSGGHNTPGKLQKYIFY